MKFLDRILGDDFSRLGALGALLALSVVLIHVPIVIYSTNSDEFTFSATEYFLLGFSLLLVAISIFRLSIAVMPRKMRKIYSGLIVSLALYIWLSSYFLVSDFGLLDGEGLNIEISSKYSMYDLFLACAIFLLVFCVAIRKTKPFIYLLVFLNVGLATITIVDVLSDDKQASLSRGVDLDPLFRFSQQGNVLIVLMDTFQSDIFADLIAENPDLKESFDGFTFFKNTLGVAPTTYLTMPAIHSGIEYYGSRSLHEYYDEAVHRRSFLSGLVDSGYEGSLINPIQGVCPRDLSLCVGSGLIFQDKMGQLIYEASKLFDIAIFRSAPFFLKADIYNNGNFRLSAATRPQHIPHAVVEGNRVLEEIGSRMVVEGGRPSVKFVHLMNTHPPFVLDDECEFVNEAQPMDRPHMTIQARCAVTAFLGLMNQLKQHDLYDDTVVMLIADTGYGSGPGIGSSYTGSLDNSYPDGRISSEGPIPYFSSSQWPPGGRSGSPTAASTSPMWPPRYATWSRLAMPPRGNRRSAPPLIRSARGGTIITYGVTSTGNGMSFPPSRRTMLKAHYGIGNRGRIEPAPRIGLASLSTSRWKETEGPTWPRAGPGQSIGAPGPSERRR